MTESSTHTFRDSHILLVEDNATNQEIILGILKDSGIQVSIAPNGQEAVDQFREHGNFDLIFMDLEMPVMDGYEATRQIRELDGEIPIIALTANTEPDDLHRTYTVGMNEHLRKPIDIETFDSVLLKYLSYRANFFSPGEKAAESHGAFSLPHFQHIDTAAGLKRVLHNEKIYITILKGLYQFKTIDLKTIADPDSFRWTVHTITGLSGSAGAHALYHIARTLNTSQDRSLIPAFQQEFIRVMDELRDLCLFDEEDDRDQTSRPEILPARKDELFARLRDACATRRIKNVKPILEEIDCFCLPFEDEIVYNDVKSLVRQFKFKRAWGILNATEKDDPDH